MASRRKTFGAKPKLWDTWIKPDDGGKDSVRELAEMKVRSIAHSSLLLYDPNLYCYDSPSPSRSLLRLFHKRQQNPRICPLPPQSYSPRKSPDMSDPPLS